MISQPLAVLFDLFHTLVSVPSPASTGEKSVSEILGVSSDEWHRLYYDDDVLGRCLGHVQDGIEAMRRITHLIDPAVSEELILTAVESRKRRFELGLVGVEGPILDALDQLREAGIKIALVSDAGADDVESWERSPLKNRMDATVFSYKLGVRKPDPRIYQHALAAIGVRPEDAIFVGDGGSDEHRGAHALGMRTVLVTRFISHWPPETIAERRRHADWEFDDVVDFVKALRP